MLRDLSQGNTLGKEEKVKGRVTLPYPWPRRTT